jgi:hypothetical protein
MEIITNVIKDIEPEYWVAVLPCPSWRFWWPATATTPAK